MALVTVSRGSIPPGGRIGSLLREIETAQDHVKMWTWIIRKTGGVIGSVREWYSRGG